MHDIYADKMKEWAKGVIGREGFGVDVIELSVNTRKITACTLKHILEREKKRIRSDLREHGKTPKGMKPMVTAH